MCVCRFSTTVASNYMREIERKTTNDVKRMTTAREAASSFAAVPRSNQRLDQQIDRQKRTRRRSNYLVVLKTYTTHLNVYKSDSVSLLVGMFLPRMKGQGKMTSDWSDVFLLLFVLDFFFLLLSSRAECYQV